jgi:hypothetical protein
MYLSPLKDVILVDAENYAKYVNIECKLPISK